MIGALMMCATEFMLYVCSYAALQTTQNSDISNLLLEIQLNSEFLLVYFGH